MTIENGGSDRPQKPSPEKRRKLRELAEWHDQWVRRWLDQAEFRPEDHREGSDYNQHYLDVNPPEQAAREQIDAVRSIMRFDPATGKRI